ncbi:MAG TPA: RDD family protein [Vicinamibacterales bacterium]|nr:RDD family protein [Vicinamibacterales bacterium]
MDNPYAPPAAHVQDMPSVTVERVPADRMIRLGAALLDGVIFGALVYLPFAFGFLVASSTSPQARGIALLFAGALCLAGLGVWAWFTIKYVRANGQSIGKRMLGIKVVRADGSAVSLGRIFWLRNVVNSLVGVIPVIGVIYGIADTLFIFTDSRQCLHDRLADTIVIVG